jgi:hypothetical protein
MTLQNLLKEYQQAGNLIKVGLVGAGQMGEGLICQMEMMYGMRAFAVADVVPGRAIQARFNPPTYPMIRLSKQIGWTWPWRRLRRDAGWPLTMPLSCLKSPI